MLINLDLLPEVLGYSVLFGTVYFLLYRRYIYSVVDPIFIFIFNTTFGSVLIIEALDNFQYIIHYFLCQLFLYIGFALVQEKTGNPAVRSLSNEVPCYTDQLLLRYVVYTLLIIYLFSNLFILYTKGFALLSDNPSSSKVTNFQGGFGLFRKINWATGGVTTAGLTFMYLNKSRRLDLMLLLLMMVLTALEGSKGALVRYAICFGLFLYHPAYRHRLELIQRIRKYVPLAIVGVFGVFFVVLSKENNGTEEVVTSFVRRLLYGADALLYFYHPVNIDYFSQFSFWDFPSYLANPILGFLRLAPYQEAFGNTMVENALPPGITLDVIVGPNSSFYTEGQVFFGYYGAFLYSFALGVLASYLRSLYFSLIRSSAFGLVYLSTIYQFSVALLVDVKLFITQAFDTVVLVLPIYVLVSLVIRHRITLRRLRFSSFTRPLL